MISQPARFKPYRPRRARGRPFPSRAKENPGREAGAEVSLPKFSLGTVLQNEGDGQVHLVAGDLAVLDQDVLVLDPGALYTTEGGGGTTDGLIDGIFKTGLRCCAQFRNAGYRHMRSFRLFSLVLFLPRSAENKLPWARGGGRVSRAPEPAR